MANCYFKLCTLSELSDDIASYTMRLYGSTTEWCYPPVTEELDLFSFLARGQGTTTITFITSTDCMATVSVIY